MRGRVGVGENRISPAAKKDRGRARLFQPHDSPDDHACDTGAQDPSSVRDRDVPKSAKGPWTSSERKHCLSFFCSTTVSELHQESGAAKAV